MFVCRGWRLTGGPLGRLGFRVVARTHRTIACELYYEDHPPYEGTGDRCSVREIEALAASEIR